MMDRLPSSLPGLNSQIAKPARGVVPYPQTDASLQTIVEQVDGERRSAGIVYEHAQAPGFNLEGKTHPGFCCRWREDGRFVFAR